MTTKDYTLEHSTEQYRGRTVHTVVARHTQSGMTAESSGFSYYAAKRQAILQLSVKLENWR